MYCWSREPSGEIMCTTIDRTAAKIGRSMKKCEKRILFLRGELAVRRMDRALLRGDGHTWAHERVRQTADHHPIGRGKPGCNDAQAARHAGQGHRLADHL